MGRLNPRRETKTKGRNGDRERKMKEEVTNRRQFLARKRRRRGRAERRLLRQRERGNRARARGREITVAAHNVRTMAVDGKHGVGRSAGVRRQDEVVVHHQPSFLPISDHNIVSAPVKLLGHFARSRRLRASAKPPVDRRRLVTDPNFDRR